MKFRGDIVLSAVVHATIVTTALALAGRDAEKRIPENYIAISLFESAADKEPGMSEIKKKGALKAPAPKRSGFVNRPPEISMPISDRKGDAPFQGPVEKRSVSTSDEARDLPGLDKGGDPFYSSFDQNTGGGSSTEAMHMPLAAGSMSERGFSRGNAPGGVEGLDVLGAIRASIERVKSYPPLARERGVEGTVTAEFTINAKGIPENITVVRSSGFQILDAAARDTILRAAPFPHVRASIEVPITFSLKKENR
jgi:TonB family protein